MKKYIISLLVLSFAIYFPAWGINFSGGSGTAADPYQISTVADLSAINDLTNSAGNAEGVYFKLTQNITEPFKGMIGTTGLFKGHFDGNGHSLRVEIDREESYVGLFGTTRNATIKNLIVEGFVKAQAVTAAVVGNPANGTLIENVVNYADVTGSSSVGGIAGSVISLKKYGTEGVTIRNCVNYGTIVGTSVTGGVIGYSGQQVGNKLQRLVNFGHVEGGNERMGGVIGNPLNYDEAQGLINMGTIGNAKIVGVLGKSGIKLQQELYYDGQYSPSAVDWPTQKKLTAELLGNNMKQIDAESQFNAQYWLFEDDMLPRLKMNGQETSPRAILYATPMLLATGNTVNDVTESFTVKCDNGVKWTAQNGRAEIGTDGKVSLKSIGEEILTATYEGYSRSIKINITAVSGIGNVVINNARHQGNDAWYTIDGRRVNQPSRGIYIHNGKKVVLF